MFDCRWHRLFIDFPGNNVFEPGGLGSGFIASKGFGPGFSKNPFQQAEFLVVGNGLRIRKPAASRHVVTKQQLAAPLQDAITFGEHPGLVVHQVERFHAPDNVKRVIRKFVVRGVGHRELKVGTVTLLPG